MKTQNGSELADAIAMVCAPKPLDDDGQVDEHGSLNSMLTAFVVVAEFVDENGATWMTHERSPGMTPWQFRGLLAQAISCVPPGLAMSPGEV